MSELHEELVRSLLVERFTQWRPEPSKNDRTELVASPTIRDGQPFQPIQAKRQHRRPSGSRSTR